MADGLTDGPWEHRDLRAGTLRLHVAVGHGLAPDRPLVLLLHGFGLTWWTWRHAVPVLAGAGFSVAALDLRGHGASDQVPHGYDPRTAAADVAAVVEVLGFDRAVLVGHDLGGLVAWATWTYAPERVRALATVAAPHPAAFPLGLTARGRRAALAAVLPGWAPRRLASGRGAGLERLLRAVAARPLPPELTPYADQVRRWPGPQRVLAYPRGFLRAAAGPGRWWSLKGEPVPALPRLSVVGDRDPWLPLAAVTEADRWVGGEHRLVRLPGVGHLPQEEAPELVTGALLDWLRRL